MKPSEITKTEVKNRGRIPRSPITPKPQTSGVRQTVIDQARPHDITAKPQSGVTNPRIDPRQASALSRGPQPSQHTIRTLGKLTPTPQLGYPTKEQPLPQPRPHELFSADAQHHRELVAQALQSLKEHKAKQAAGGSGPIAAITGLVTGKGPLYKAALNLGSTVGTGVTKGIEAIPGEASVLNSAIPALGIVKAGGKPAAETLGNVAKEGIDFPANITPSTYRLLKPAVEGYVSGVWKGKPGDVLGGVVGSGSIIKDQYSHLLQHPAQSLHDNPLTSALMIAEPLKAADRLAGRIEQRAVPGLPPKRPYAPIAEKLPGTAAKNIILPRQGAIANRIQTHMHTQRVPGTSKRITPRMSDAQIQRRADELFYTGINQTRQDAYAAIKDAQSKGLHKAKVQEVGIQAKQDATDRWHDIASTDMALRDSKGQLRTFHFHEGKGGVDQFMEKWGQSMINKGKDAVMQEYEHNDRTYRGARGKDVQTLVPQQLKTGPLKGRFVIVPKMAADQLAQHRSYLMKTPLSALLQGVGGTFRRTVLPFQPKWLANNYNEMVLRGAINGVGPVSAKEGYNVFGKLPEQQKQEWNQLVKSAGHGGLQRQLLQEATTWEERLKHTRYEELGKSITRYGSKPGPKTLSTMFDKWTDFVFSDLNGRAENFAHMGMAGKTLRRNPLMSQQLLDYSHKAMNEFSKGQGMNSVEARNILIALGRETDRMFGRYGKFSPGMRRSIATWTPFIPWSLNAFHFVTQHLPKDHPVVTSLMATASQASQEWRKQHGLSWFTDGQVPPWMMGAVPGNNGSHWLIFNQGTPFSAWGDPTGTVARGFNPLGQTIINNLNGNDWKNQPLGKTYNPLVNVQTAILSLLEATNPIGYAVQKATGGSGANVGENLKNWANPYHPVKSKDSSSGGSDWIIPGSNFVTPGGKSDWVIPGSK